MKCQGKVYDLERITSKSGVWHRQCYNCSGCKCNLTSTLDDAYDEQGQLYCKPCLKKYFTENPIIPMTYSDPKKLPAKGKKHAFKIYDQFALNTSCFWGSTISNITPVVQFHEIFVTKIMNPIDLLLLLKQKFREIPQLG